MGIWERRGYYTGPRKKKFPFPLMMVLCAALVIALIAVVVRMGGDDAPPAADTAPPAGTTLPAASPPPALPDEIPPYSGKPYIELNGDIPGFTAEDVTREPFERYSDLDGLGRCGPAFANVCKELMPTDDREDISSVEPTGYHNHWYDWIDHGFVYNRCHLIAFAMTGENANEKNLITGTRYMNLEGMFPFESKVLYHASWGGHHVLYRVTPVFEGDDLVARGVQMEGWSVEDEGESVCFNVFVYNVQPGVVIDYATGENYAEEGYVPTAAPAA